MSFGSFFSTSWPWSNQQSATESYAGPSASQADPNSPSQTSHGAHGRASSTGGASSNSSSNVSTWDAISKIAWQALEMGRDGALYVADFTRGQLTTYRTKLHHIQTDYSDWQKNITITGSKVDGTLESAKGVLVQTWVAAMAVTYVAHKLLGLGRGIPLISPLFTLAQKASMVAAFAFSWEVYSALHAINIGREVLLDQADDNIEHLPDMWSYSYRKQIALSAVHAYRRWSIAAVVSESVKGMCDEVRAVWLGQAPQTPNLEKLSSVVSWIDWGLEKLGVVKKSLGGEGNNSTPTSSTSNSFSDLGENKGSDSDDDSH